MKHKKIVILLILLIVIITVLFISFFKNQSNASEMQEQRFEKIGMERGNKLAEKNSVISSSNCEISSALIEDVKLHTTYYLSKVYVEENQYVKKGAKILKYTNGTYLTAPYDCYIVEMNIPEIEGKCVNDNYIKIESKNILAVSLQIDETQINKLEIGQEATIEVLATSQTYKGNVTHIGSIANNGKFDVTIEFENDGNVMIGMTSDVKITT